MLGIPKSYRNTTHTCGISLTPALQPGVPRSPQTHSAVSTASPPCAAFHLEKKPKDGEPFAEAGELIRRYAVHLSALNKSGRTR